MVRYIKCYLGCNRTLFQRTQCYEMKEINLSLYEPLQNRNVKTHLNNTLGRQNMVGFIILKRFLN